MKMVYTSIFNFMIQKVKRVVSQSRYAKQGCVKGCSAKEAVVMDSFVERLQKIHENKFFYSFKKGILHFLNATCQLATLTLFSEPVDFVWRLVLLRFLLFWEWVLLICSWIATLQILSKMKFYTQKIQLHQHKKLPFSAN